MKYYQSSKFPKFIGSAGFYTIIIGCLLAIGAASWFAVSRFNRDEAPSEAPSSKIESADDKMPSYSSAESSYNSIISSTESIISQITPNANVSENVAGEVSDIPYSSEEEKPEETPSFIFPATGNISKGFSDTALQYSATYGDMRMHTGVDIVCKKGTEIKSAGSGKVISAEKSAAFGTVVAIEHSNGITVKYCGLENAAVVAGDSVNAGSIIGTLGTIPDECADQSHLHIEVIKDGKTVSPLAALGLE